MRHLRSLVLIALAAELSACGGSSNNSTTTTTVPLTYSIGGTLAGLSGTLVLQNNGGDNLTLSGDGPFTFSVSLQPSAPYAVTILTQPANQVCSVSNGSGTASASVTNVSVTCSLSSTATDVWTWVAGSNYADGSGVYGTLGTAAAANTPGARRNSIAWTDAAGNFWLFGGNGIGNDGMLNDLWQFSASAQQWVWQGGADSVGTAASYGSQGTPAATNNPGAREGSAKWIDAAGNLWLFGGDSLAAQTWEDLNDLWSYNPSTGFWTWVGGSSTAGNAGSYGTLGVTAASNLPPARTDAMSWVDSAGVFWLFGGTQLSAAGSYADELNDLWSYNPTTSMWTWVGGSATANAVGVYGMQGTAAAGNVPGARMGGSVWLDASGNVWLFGGLGPTQGGVAQEYNDLWEYNPGSAEWAWIGGSDAPNASGSYGTQRAPLAGNSPGAREAAVSWTDSSGNFWLFGGYGFAQGNSSGNLNDLWEYSLGTGVWTWIGGSSATAAEGTYGTQGIPAANNVPGAREAAVGWVDLSGHFWLFGGYGFDSSGEEDDLNDLWSFSQGP